MREETLPAIILFLIALVNFIAFVVVGFTIAAVSGYIAWISAEEARAARKPPEWNDVVMTNEENRRLVFGALEKYNNSLKERANK